MQSGSQLVQSPGASGAQPAESPGAPVALLAIAGLLVPALLAYFMTTGTDVKVFAVVLAIAAGVLIIASPYWGLVAYIGLLYVRPEETVSGLAGTHLVLAAAIITLVGTYLKMALNRESPARTPMTGLIIGFALWAVAGTLDQGTTSQAAQDLAKNVITVLLVLNLARTQQQQHTLNSAVIFFTLYLALYSIHLQYAGGGLVRSEGDQTTIQSQATGIFNDPNDLSAAIVAGLGMVLVRVRLERGWLRCLYAAAAGLMFWAIILCNSRGGFLATMICCCCVVVWGSKHRRRALLWLPVVVVTLLAFGGGRMTKYDTDDESANQRFWAWDAGVTALEQNPVRGLGYGQFPAYNGGLTAHNSFVLCFAELGLPGYLLWIACLYCAFRPGKLTEQESAENDIGFHGADSRGLHAEAERNLLESRIALAAFLSAAYWISRTYVPVLYLLIALPVAAQLVHSSRGTSKSAGARLQQLDWSRIALASLGSIIFIKMMADHYK